MHEPIFENLKQSVFDCEPDEAATWARKALEENIDPLKAMDALTEAIKEVGDGFERGELFLPELVGAADAMQAAARLIEEEINRKGVAMDAPGTVVIGTVFGDIHDIGKSMVSTLLTAAGYKVYDIGINVPIEKFIEAVKNHQPDILALSALLTTTAMEQKKVIDALKQEGLRDTVKVMVGGAAITREFADSIGADAYEATAPKAVRRAREFIGR